MSGLRFPESLHAALVKDMLADKTRESCAVIFTRRGATSDSWIAVDYAPVPECQYERRDAISAVISTSFLVETANRARKEKFGVVVAHTHPIAAGRPEFSSVDDEGELPLAEYFNRRIAHAEHLALVIGPDGCRARRLGIGGEVNVWSVGEHLVPVCSTLDDVGKEHQRFDRQARAFGQAGQYLVQRLKVAIVGAGGTGSATVQQLAYLGVSDFLVIDPDLVATTNLNRLIGAGPADVGKPKVDVARDMILRISPAAQVTTMQRDIIDADVAPRIAEADFIFLCTDSHASRAVVAQIAYQYLVPTIDMGVSITVRDGVVTHITGRVQMLAPGLPCLVCTDALDGKQIREELMTPEQRAADPYVQGIHEPQPAVISINSTVASLAITMFLGAVTPVPAHARFQFYDGLRGTVRPTSATSAENCIVCSSAGALARGSSWGLPVRPMGGRDE